MREYHVSTLISRKSQKRAAVFDKHGQCRVAGLINFQFGIFRYMSFEDTNRNSIPQEGNQHHFPYWTTSYSYASGCRISIPNWLRVRPISDKLEYRRALIKINRDGLPLHRPYGRNKIVIFTTIILNCLAFGKVIHQPPLYAELWSWLMGYIFRSVTVYVAARLVNYISVLCQMNITI